MGITRAGIFLPCARRPEAPGSLASRATSILSSRAGVSRFAIPGFTRNKPELAGLAFRTGVASPKGRTPPETIVFTNRRSIAFSTVCSSFRGNNMFPI